MVTNRQKVGKALAGMTGFADAGGRQVVENFD